MFNMISCACMQVAKVQTRNPPSSRVPINDSEVRILLKDGGTLTLCIYSSRDQNGRSSSRNLTCASTVLHILELLLHLGGSRNAVFGPGFRVWGPFGGPKTPNPKPPDTTVSYLNERFAPKCL